MSARVEAIKRLFDRAARMFGEDGIRHMPINTLDRGNEDEATKVYSMCYRTDQPSLLRFCGPDWTFVFWPECNIPSYEETRDEVIKAGETTPKTEKACWFGNMNSPTKGVAEHITRPRLVQIGKQNPEIMDVRHVFPPLPAHHPEYRSMPDLVREYRAIIDIGGNGYSGRIKWLLFSRRPILMVQRMHVEYFHHELKPWEHYVPVRMDLSDIVEKVNWTLENGKEAREMSERALSFALENFTEERLLERVRDVWVAMK